jgi:hypothetical protein
MLGEYLSPAKVVKITNPKPQTKRDENKVRPRGDGSTPGSCLVPNPNDSYVDKLSQYLLKKRVVDRLQKRSVTEAKK